MKYDVTWEVEDGYCGGSRPHHYKFDSENEMDDEEWNELSEEDKFDIIYTATQEEFEQRVSYVVTNTEKID